MRIANLDTADKVIVIAEVGNNHEGSLALAEEMAGRAAESGADIVKFQTFVTEHYVSPTQAERFARLKSFELSREAFVRLKAVTEAAGAVFLSTPFDPGSARFLGGLAAAIKISSGDNTFYPLLEAAAACARPLLLSCGLAELDDILFARALIHRVWREQGHGTEASLEVAALHCVSSYPTPPAEANLRAIGQLASHFPTVGYSDHTLGTTAAVLAVAAGARIVEKHFTLDKNYSPFRDHQLSATPDELREMVLRIREAEELLGRGDRFVSPSELEARPIMRRSLAAARDLPAGHALTWEDITWVRPAGGLAPGQECQALGRTLARSIRAGETLDPETLT